MCLGDDDCCTSTHPCDVGRGDCDFDSHCRGPLICGSNNCLDMAANDTDVADIHEFDEGDDCCEEKPVVPDYDDKDPRIP